MARIILALALTTLALSGCKTPVGVRETGFQPVYQDLRANVLDEGVPSSASQQVVSYFGLEERYGAEPVAAIAELEEINLRERVRELQVVIAELTYDLALEEEDRGRFLESAIHAYLYLFGEGFRDAPNPYSPRFRLACDLYNRGLARAMRNPSGKVRLVGGDVVTPSGTIKIQCTRPGFPWGEEDFSTFLPADVFEVRGLRERVRDPGLGVPLIAIQSGNSGRGLKAEHVGTGIKLPATAFLRLNGGLDELVEGSLSATLELYLGSDVLSLEVAGQPVPLEADITAPLAYTLEESDIWSFGLRGFLKGRTKDFQTGVFMLQPYQKGKIPLVLIHGTASSPAAWAQTINGIKTDRRLRSRYQVWLALYNTGNPIAYSTSLLREALIELLHDLDSQGDDPALSDMVIVGHSQGGLVTRLLLSESGDRLWKNVTDEPFETYELSPEASELLGKALFFEPLPFARRAVFISTPHRGSYVAGGWIGRFASRLVKLPGNLRRVAAEFVEGDGLPEEMGKIPTSVDNMKPNNRFVRSLAELEFGQGLHLHSIISVKPGRRPVEQGNDGVVEYKSAHLEQAESELVVRHEHSCQGQPETIGELRRILSEHLEAHQP